MGTAQESLAAPRRFSINTVVKALSVLLMIIAYPKHASATLAATNSNVPLILPQLKRSVRGCLVQHGVNVSRTRMAPNHVW